MKEIKSVLIISIVAFIAVFLAVYLKGWVDSQTKNSNQIPVENKTDVVEDVKGSIDTKEVEETETEAKTIVKPAPVLTKSKVIATKPKPAPKPAPKPVTACIVTISGSKYNVTSLQRSHSGGNVFVCGTDMTVVYIKQHGKNYSLISKYKV
ncbi:hypothetical protein M0R04_01495 [Candidatus Dojkabacteria bacterium]|jgi:cytoskeletal protein RodZ|nr:hypothetical protein [Candidatus Dojkabacteria bacterium]